MSYMRMDHSSAPKSSKPAVWKTLVGFIVAALGGALIAIQGPVTGTSTAHQVATWVLFALVLGGVICCGIGLWQWSDASDYNHELKQLKYRHEHGPSSLEKIITQAFTATAQQVQDEERRKKRLEDEQHKLEVARLKQQRREVAPPPKPKPSPPSQPQPSREEQRRQKMIEIEADRKRFHRELAERKAAASTPGEAKRWENFYADAERELDEDLKKWLR